MALEKWKCVTCEKEFKVGDWYCADGSTHVVSEKTYRVLDAPTDPGRPAEGTSPSIVRGRTVVCNIPPAKKVMENGEVKLIGEGSVEFLNGFFATTNPEQQYWLDKKPAYNATEAQWKSVWLTKDEQLFEKEQRLKSLELRIENDRNDLLAKTKQKVAVPA